jgi:hypothetical protein
MSTTEILRGYGLKLPAVALALGLIAAPRAYAVERADLAPAAGAVKRAAATRLAKAKKKKKKADTKADSDADTGSAGSSDAAEASGGGSDDDREAAVLGSSKKKAPPAPSDGDEDSSNASSSSGTRASRRPRAAASEDEDSGDGTKVAKRAAAPASQEEPSEGPAVAGTALEVGLGGAAMFRNLVWTSDGAAAQLGPYSLSPGPEAGLWLEFYPAAFVTSGFASNVGLYARYAYGFGVTSKLQSGVDASTSYQDFVAGIKVRLPLGTFTPYGTVSYGEQQFSVAPQGAATDLPAMDYSFVRIGLGTRIQLSPMVGLDVGAAFLAVTNAGSGLNQLASLSYFPQTAAYAGEAGTSLSFRLTSKVGARIGGDFRQYGMAFHPQAGAARQVTGAVDRYIVAWGGLEVLLDGLGGGTTDDEPAHTPKRRHHASDDSSDDDSSKSDEKPASKSDDKSDDE